MCSTYLFCVLNPVVIVKADICFNGMLEFPIDQGVVSKHHPQSLVGTAIHKVVRILETYFKKILGIFENLRLDIMD